MGAGNLERRVVILEAGNLERRNMNLERRVVNLERRLVKNSWMKN